MPSLRSPRATAARLTATVAALALLAGACADAGDPGLSVDPVKADIVFGVKDPEAPANTPAAPLTPETAAGDFDLPPSVFGPTKKKPLTTLPTFTTAPPVQRPACPPAAINEFPDESATPSVYPPKRLPEEGLYRWKKAGVQNINGFELAVTGFEQRAIRSVEVVEETTEGPTSPRIRYTYQTVQPELSTGLVVYTDWYVDSNPAADGETNLNSPAVRVNRGEPERGLVIRRIERKTANGDRIRDGVVEFAPGAGLLMLPLPIRQGEQWSSRAIDPRTGRSLRVDGQVRDRERVDACGDVLDGWRVNTTLTTEDGSTREYSYIVATQLGGYQILEQVKTDTSDITYSIGQVKPDPLPAQEGEE